MERVAADVQGKVDIPIERLGPAGIRNELHFVAVIPGETRNDDERLRDLTVRRFKVFGRLSKLPPATDSISADFSEADGSSYLEMPAGAAKQKVETSFGTFMIGKNGLGELSLVEFECDATNSSDARNKFFQACLPFLDHTSFLTNAPIFVSCVRIEDTKNNVVSIDFIAPYAKVVVPPSAYRLFSEMRPVYAMFREGKNAGSDFYKFLSYYKILEGLLGKIRADTYQRAREAGKALPRLTETVPASPELPAIHRPYVGRPLKYFFDNVLTPQFRNAVAHFGIDGGIILDASNPAHIEQYSSIILISELCVRQAIRNQETLLAHLHSSANA